MMCEEALIALPQGGFGGMGGSTGVPAGLTASHPRKRMTALRLPRVKEPNLSLGNICCAREHFVTSGRSSVAPQRGRPRPWKWHRHRSTV